ncbi:MAG TPA: M20/M25/M40 family metallo-hydrolase [Terriglobales bacterium]|nr:M20/M25/M40 family metallo-hydrolase [Terriglobales bacterium]
MPGKLSQKHSRLLGLAFVALIVGLALAGSLEAGPRHQNNLVAQAEGVLSPDLKQQLIALRDAALGDDYAYKQVAYLTENIGPRPSGSAQSVKAAQYVADQMRSLGLEVRLEEVKVPHWVRGAETAELIDFPGQVPNTTQRVFVTSLGGSTSTPADGLTAEVVVVRNFSELASLGRSKIAGKIVLFNFPFDTRKADAGHALDAYSEAVIYRSSGAKAAAELGAVASLIRSVGGAEYRLPHTGYSVPAGIPAGAVAAEDASLIADLATQGKIRMHLTLVSQDLPETTGYNVIADLKGSEHPEQVVVVSGHLDSWDLGTGAIDDAAGVAVAMEAAQLIQQLHYRPKRTLRVIAWVDEESGGRGRTAYTTAHGTEFADHVAAIESDLGAAHPLGFTVKISQHAVEFLHPVQEILQSFGASLIESIQTSPGSDISAMAQAGVPALGIMQDGRTYFNYHHSAADTLDKIEPRALRENAAAMVVMGFALACTEQPLPR